MKYEAKRKLILGISLFLLLIFYLFKNISESLRVFGFIFGLLIFYFADHMFEIDFKSRHYYYMIVILAFGILFSPLYSFYPVYDKILHFAMPILGCFLIFHIVDKKDLNIQWKLWVVFLFIMTSLTIHEIGEYLIDQLWDLKLQGVYIRNISGAEKLNLVMSKIDDTMIDLIIGAMGSLFFIAGKTISYFYKKK